MLAFANSVINWQKNLPEDEMPPRWMWPFSDELEEHFKEIKIARKQKSNKNDSDDSVSSNMIENEYAR